MLFSKTTKGFYSIEVHWNNIPDDAVEITDEEYQILLNGQSSGKIIIADENGRPALSDPVVIETLAEKLLKLAQAYKADLQEFNLAWLAASVSDGSSEAPKKEDISAEIAARKAKYISDVAEAKASFSS